MLSPERETAQAIRRRRATGDRVAFARLAGVEPDPWQRRFLASDAPRILLNNSRQSGKSTTSALLALHKVLYEPGALVLCLAPALRQSQELFQKIQTYYRAVGKPIAAVTDRRLGIELENGSRIETLPGDERTIRGYSGVDLLLVDEAARVSDDLYHAIRPMLAVSGGRLVMLSSPWGKRGVFFEEWEYGSGWERYEIKATDCPRISPEFLAEERRTLPARVFDQEYMCQFSDTIDQIFPEELIQSLGNDDLEELEI